LFGLSEKHLFNNRDTQYSITRKILTIGFLDLS
jgi:hypothetical protein